jgi:hypothetical protein
VRTSNQASNGTWTFFQPCQRTSEPLDFTTTVLNDDYYMCNHLKSADKPGGGGIGTQMSAAMSWQGSETSFAWASPSKLMGLTFQAMVDDALRERPENIMLPSFDRYTATRVHALTSGSFHNTLLGADCNTVVLFLLQDFGNVLGGTRYCGIPTRRSCCLSRYIWSRA